MVVNIFFFTYRASNKPEKPNVIPSKRDDSSPSSPHRPVKKLEDNRRLMLEQQLGRIPTLSCIRLFVFKIFIISCKL